MSKELVGKVMEKRLMKRILPIFNLILPSILFYWIYQCLGIISATVFSILISGFSQAVSACVFDGRSGNGLHDYYFYHYYQSAVCT